MAGFTFRLGFLGLGLKADGQRLFNVQFSHFGAIGLHICWPNPTKRKLMSAHKARGSHDSSVLRVNSGVAFVGTQPRREHTLLTFVSTIKPSSPMSNATHKTSRATFGPTPGSFISSSSEHGTDPLCGGLESVSAMDFIYFAFLLELQTTVKSNRFQNFCQCIHLNRVTCNLSYCKPAWHGMEPLHGSSRDRITGL